MFRASVVGVFAFVLLLNGTARGATFTVGQSGQDFTTVTAAFANAISVAGDHTIQIEDDNGGAGYSSAGTLDLTAAANKNITITSLVAVRIVCTNSALEVVRNSTTDATPKKLSVIGASNAARITLANTGATNNVAVVTCRNTAASSTFTGLIHLENVNLEKPSTGTIAGPFVRMDSLATAQQYMKNVSLIGSISTNASANLLVGPWDTTLTGDVYLESVSFSQAAGSGGMLSIRNRVNLEAKSSTFQVPSGSNQACVFGITTTSPSTPTGGSQVIFRDCSFKSGTADAFATLGETSHTTRNVYKLYRPTITAAGQNCFNLADRPVEVYVLGLDDSDLPTVAKVNLGSITGALRLAQLRGNNKFSLQYCTASGGAGSVGQGSVAYTGNPEIEYKNCELLDTGRILFNGMTGAFAPTINLTNTLFRTTSFISGPYIDNTTSDVNAVPAQITLTHCTFSGNVGSNPPNAYLSSNVSDLVYAPGTIFNGASTAYNYATLSGVTYALGTIQPSTTPTLAWNSAGLSGFGSVPPGTIVANPNLSATGRLTAASPAAVFSAATTPLVTNDIDNNARPLPAAAAGNDLGADEALFPVTDLALSNLTVSDDVGDGAYVGTITVTDPDNDSTLSLSADGGGRFALSGNDLVVGDSALLDGVAIPIVMVEVQANDLGGAIYAEFFPITVTHAAPTVVSAAVQDGNTVRVTFSRAMGALALDPAQYTVSGTGQGTLGTNPASVTAQSATEYDLVWNAPDEMYIGGDITITVAGTVLDLQGGALGAPDNATDAGAGIGVSPTLDSVTGITSSPTNADDVAFAFTFSEPMASLPGADVLVGGTGTASTGVTVTDGPTTFTATVNGVSGDGTLSAGLAATPTATDLAGNPVGASALSASVDIDNTPPTVQSMLAPDANPTNAPTLLYTVTLSDPVTGVSTSDFALTGSGGITGATVLGVTPVSTTVYGVSVSRGAGSGTLRLDVVANGTLGDLAGNALAAPFTSGPAYTIAELAFTQNLPSAVQLVVGDAASFAVTVGGGLGARQYTWYYAEELAGPYSLISGETQATLTIDPATELNSGYYYVEVSDDNETIVSNTAHLSVDDGIPVAGIWGAAALLAGLGLAARRALRKH